jgi:hydroxymethylpyrimidine pyrophosphatase-like HAD family hydrolase
MYSTIITDDTALLAENGNLIMVNTKIYQTALYGWPYFNALSVIKNAVKDILMDKVSAIEPKQFILTVFAEDRVPELEKLVEGFEFLKCMWNGEAYDIQYKHMSKGLGLKKLRRLMHVRKDEVVAVGDRINDKELLDEAGIGITVDPIALPAKYWASSGQEVVNYMLEKESYAES